MIAYIHNMVTSMRRFYFLFLTAITVNSAFANDSVGQSHSAGTSSVKSVTNVNYTDLPTNSNQPFIIKSSVLPHPISHLTPNEMYEQTKKMLIHSTLQSSLDKYSVAEQNFIKQFLKDIISGNGIQVLPITSVAPHFMDEQLEKFKQCRQNKESVPSLFYTSQYMAVGLGPYVIYDIDGYYFIEAYNYIEDEELSRSGYTFYQMVDVKYDDIYRKDMLNIIEKPIKNDELCKIARLIIGTQGRPSTLPTLLNYSFIVLYQKQYAHLEIMEINKGFSIKITLPHHKDGAPHSSRIHLNLKRMLQK